MQKEQLHLGAKWSFRISAYIFVIILAMIISTGTIAGLLLFIGLKGVIFLAIIIIIIGIVIAEVYTQMAYNRFFYEFDKDSLKIERGIIWKKYSNIPYDRVQNVDITRGIIARICGFSTINIQTAGYGGFANGRGQMSEGYVPATGIKRAEQIRDFLMKKISGKRSKGM